MENQEVSVDSTFDVPVTLVNDEDDGDDIQGFAWGVCHDGDYLTIDAVEFTSVIDDLSVIFSSTTLHAAPGYTLVVALSIGTVIEPGFDEEVCVATYTADGESAAEKERTDLEFCETLGDLEVSIEVIVDLVSILPTTVNGSIAFVAPPPPATISVCNSTVSYNADTNDPPPVDIRFFIEGNPEHPDHPQDTQGFQFGLAHDSTYLEPVDVRDIGVLAELNSGEGPEFFGINLDPVLPDGVNGGLTVICAYDFSDEELLAFDERTELLDIEYEVVGDPDDLEGTPTPLEFRTDIGDPEVVPFMVIAGAEFTPFTKNGSVTFDLIQGDGLLFRRGDPSGDGIVSPLFDAFFLLRFGFSDGPAPPCESTADVNGDGKVSVIPDAVALFIWGFGMGTVPPAPGPDQCGTDPQELGCDEPPVCEPTVTCD